ncbi:MAG: glycine--tRNA ligase subunit beta [Elusimicrobia bacterium]|nr:glycine--tRNA ligase subunit beta [Elusimicrobiota bacterium]
MMKETILTKQALLEIGVEEIPALYIEPALESMRAFSENFLRSKKLEFENITVLGSPRRLALLITGISAKTETSSQEIWGPSLKAAKNSDGEWSKAALGFSRSQDISIESLQIRMKKGEEFLCFLKRFPGEKAQKILKELFLALMPEIPFPKKMVWNSSRFKFARPIRNLLALYDHEILRLNIAGIMSSNKTFGLRGYSKHIAISSPMAYLNTLKNNCILVDPRARRESILNTSNHLANKVKGKLQNFEDLLNEVLWLVEHPVSLLCNFDPKFLALPQAILVTCMKKHQKFFSILDESGKLMPHFIGIRNGISEHQEIVRKGYEKVLTARLTDAEFFLKEDLKLPLEAHINKASSILIQEQLGSIAHKIERMKNLSKIFLNALPSETKNSELDLTLLERAIERSKFDLSTHMVYEFPELQGIVGFIYANHYGENKMVAQAIQEHYYPLTAQGELPASLLGSMLAFLDKLDHLVGNFLVGRVSSGSSDAYGLKRASTGFLRIILERNWELELKELVQGSVKQFNLNSKENHAQQVLDFLRERFQLLMQDQGYFQDEILAVTKNFLEKDANGIQVLNLKKKISALHVTRTQPNFEAVTISYKRLSNILRQAKEKGISYSKESLNPELLKILEEQALKSWLESSSKKIVGLTQEKKYEEALFEMMSAREFLDNFFEKVMVMDPDPALSLNRLSLLSLLESLFKEIADFSYLQPLKN